jgi:hypothetical protein
MTVHAPAHPGGVVSPHVTHHYFAWLAVAAAIALAIGALLIVPGVIPGSTTSMSAEQKSVIQYRAAERLDWAGSETYPAWMIDFRAAEREGR